MSMDVREGRGLQVGDYGKSRVIRRDSIGRDEMRELVLGADQLLCGRNMTRQTYNARIRHLRGHAGTAAPHHPVKGERLVCLRNNRLNGVLNGSLWEATQVKANGARIEMRVNSIDDLTIPQTDVVVREEFFTGEEKKLEWDDLRGTDQFTFGHALTVHKSQGSQWNDVILFDESQVFREDREKHLYTGITRASERVTVIV
jgi:exodeoxyribonuclease-5